MAARQLAWDGCVNVRDLGGLATRSGHATAYGAVVRADDLTGLSETGWETLEAYGVRRIVDLRWPHEVAEQPPHRAEIEVVHVSLFGDEWDGLDRDRRFADIADYAERRQALYLERLERYRTRFAEAILAVAYAPEGCVAIHCVAGVDRTGLVSALLLGLAGVDPDAIADDYGRSEPSWAARVAVWMEEAADDEERAARRFLATVPAAAMSGVLRALEDRHGDIDGYLRESGLDEDDLLAARRRLLP